MDNYRQPANGFTLLEILVVIGMIAILATIVIVAINPARQFAQGRNTQRQANVNTILNAIGQRIAENKGTFEGVFTVGSNSYTCPVLIAGTNYNIASASDAGNIDLSCLTPTYIPSQLPVGPVKRQLDEPKQLRYQVPGFGGQQRPVYSNGQRGIRPNHCPNQIGDK